MKFAKNLCLFVAFCITLIFFPSCGENQATSATGSPDTLKIVSSLPRTGTSNAQTTSIVNGIKMALDEISYKIGSFTLKFEDWDDASAKLGKWDPEVEAQNAERAIRDADIVAYIGTYNSGAAKISMPRLNTAGLLMVSPGNTAVGLTKPGKGEKGEPAAYRPTGKVTYFRVVPADDIQAPCAAHWAKNLGFKSVFILNDREVYGKGIADMLEKECRTIGINVLGNEGIDSKQLEYRGQVVKIKDLNPDLVYFSGITDSNPGQLIKDMRAVGLNCPVMVPDGCREESFITSAGPENLNDRCYVTFGGFPPDKLTGKGAIFYKNFKEKFKIEPEAYAVYGYEAGLAVIEAIKRANVKDRTKIIEACRTIKDFEGAMGKWGFDENGDTTVSLMSGEIIRNGKFEFVTQLSVNDAPTSSAGSPAGTPAAVSPSVLPPETAVPAPGMPATGMPATASTTK